MCLYEKSRLVFRRLSFAFTNQLFVGISGVCLVKWGAAAGTAARRQR